MAAVAALRCTNNEDLIEIGTLNLRFSSDKPCKSYKEDIEASLSAILASEFEKHFLPATDVEKFDSVSLSTSEKEELFLLMAEARLLTQKANFLEDNHKNRILHRISDVESELLKDKSNFKTFLAAAADVSGLVKNLEKTQSHSPKQFKPPELLPRKR